MKPLLVLLAFVLGCSNSELAQCRATEATSQAKNAEMTTKIAEMTTKIEELRRDLSEARDRQEYTLETEIGSGRPETLGSYHGDTALLECESARLRARGAYKGNLSVTVYCRKH